MDKQKQIEEMAIIINGSTEMDTMGYYRSVEKAKNIYNAGYRKIPENAVVLTREDYDELQIGKDFNYGVHSGESNMTAYYENIRLPEVRKETAEKFAEMAKELLDKQEKGWSANMIWIITAKNCIDETCKKITEG